MTEEQVKQIVIDIINEIAPDEDTSNLKSEVNLRDQMDLDSMDFLDIVMELRNSMVLRFLKKIIRSLLH